MMDDEGWAGGGMHGGEEAQATRRTRRRQCVRRRRVVDARPRQSSTVSVLRTRPLRDGANCRFNRVLPAGGKGGGGKGGGGKGFGATAFASGGGSAFGSSAFGASAAVGGVMGGGGSAFVERCRKQRRGVAEAAVRWGGREAAR